MTSVQFAATVWGKCSASLPVGMSRREGARLAAALPYLLAQCQRQAGKVGTCCARRCVSLALSCVAFARTPRAGTSHPHMNDR